MVLLLGTVTIGFIESMSFPNEGWTQHLRDESSSIEILENQYY